MPGVLRAAVPGGWFGAETAALWASLTSCHRCRDVLAGLALSCPSRRWDAMPHGTSHNQQHHLQPWDCSGFRPHCPSTDMAVRSPAGFPCHVAIYKPRVAQGWDCFFRDCIKSVKWGKRAVYLTSCMWAFYLCNEFSFPLELQGSNGIRSSLPQWVVKPRAGGVSSPQPTRGKGRTTVICGDKPSPETGQGLGLGNVVGAPCCVLTAEPSSLSSHFMWFFSMALARARESAAE